MWLPWKLEIPRKIAGATKGLDSLRVLFDEDIATFAKVFVDVKILSLARLRCAGRSVPGLVYSQMTTLGAHLTIAPQELVKPGGASNLKKCDFVEIDMIAELGRRPILRNVRNVRIW